MQQIWIKTTSDGEVYGPYSQADLKQFVIDGNVQRTSLVSVDQIKWHAATRVKNLFPAATSVAPVAPRAAESLPEAEVAPAPAEVTNDSPSSHVAQDTWREEVGAVSQVPFAAETPAAVSTLEYANPRHAVVADRGVFIFLHIVALVIGPVLAVAGTALAVIFLRRITYRPETLSYVSLVAFVVLAVVGAVYAISGLLGLIGLSVKRLLFLASICMIAFQIYALVAGFLLISERGAGLPDIFHSPMQYMHEIQRFIFMLAFPILCIVACMASRRSKG